MLQRHFSRNAVRIRTAASISSYFHSTAPAAACGNSRRVVGRVGHACLIHGRVASFGSPAAAAAAAGRVGDWSLVTSSKNQTRISNGKKSTTTIRAFHATPRQEILPLIGVAAIVLTARYSWKAMKRMDSDWEDYYWQLERYERFMQQQDASDDVNEKNSSSNSTVQQQKQHANNNIAIDLGSVYTKLATFSSKPHQNQQQQHSGSSEAAAGKGRTRRIPEILISPRGERSLFNGILYTEYPPTATAPATRGQAALEKFYYYHDKQQQATKQEAEPQQQGKLVTLPWKDLEQAAHSHLDVSNVVADVLSPALKESLERLDNYDDVYKKGIIQPGIEQKGHDDDSQQNSSHLDHPVLRAVVTLPVQYLHHHDSSSYRSAFDKIWKDFQESHDSSTAHHHHHHHHHAPSPATIFLPDAVAAIWGAQALGILPDNNDEDYYLNELAVEKQNKGKDSGGAEKKQHSHGRRRRPPKRIMVVDVGGFTSQFSIVDEYHIVRASITIPWGGETILERMVDCLLIAEEKSAGSSNSSSRTIADNDARALAALQFHARQALPVFALRSKSQVNIHVPYIFATPGNHHLDTVLSRSVLEQVIQEDIRQRLVAQLVTKNDNNNDDIRRLSRHMPVPNDMSSLFTSILTQLLESANEMPQGIHHILLVGGASQFPLVQSSLESSVSLLWGALLQQQQQLQQQLLIIPTTSVHATELVVLGAATMLPSFTYNVNRGLERATR